IRTALLAALDDWIAGVPDPAARARLAELTRAAEAEPDAWQARLRTALARADRAALRDLAAGDVATVPAGALALWGPARIQGGAPRPRPPSAGPWSSSRGSPRRGRTSARPSKARAAWTRQQPPTARPSGSTHTTAWRCATCSPSSGDRARRRRSNRRTKCWSG